MYNTKKVAQLVKGGVTLHRNPDASLGRPDRPEMSLSSKGILETEPPDGAEVVDLRVVLAAVDRAYVYEHAAEFQAAIGDGQGKSGVNLGEGPSIIALQEDLGSAETALKFMVFGKTLGLWRIVDPGATTPVLTSQDRMDVERLIWEGVLHASGWESTPREEESLTHLLDDPTN